MKSYLLLGVKYAKIHSQKVLKGPGSSEKANFDFDYKNYPNYVNQSSYKYPNNNFAFFGENIFIYKQ